MQSLCRGQRDRTAVALIKQQQRQQESQMRRRKGKRPSKSQWYPLDIKWGIWWYRYSCRVVSGGKFQYCGPGTQPTDVSFKGACGEGPNYIVLLDGKKEVLRLRSSASCSSTCGWHSVRRDEFLRLLE